MNDFHDHDDHRADDHRGRGRRDPALGRRAFLGVSAGALAATVTGGGLAYAQQQRASATTPDPTPLTPMTVRTDTARAAAGDIYYTDMGPSAAVILADRHGVPIWHHGGAASYADFRRQSYRGRHVLSYWESPTEGLSAYSEGRDVITGLHHATIATFDRDATTTPDEHELLITERGTAFITSCVRTAADLRPVGGSADGIVMDGQWCEIDLATGEVLNRWSPLAHIDFDESYAGVPADPTEPWDFFHINAICPLPDGDLLVSARHTWTVYRIDPTTGAIRWRLGGKRSDFDVPADARFAWQHDARWESDTAHGGIIRMFDNGSDGTSVVHADSHILWLDVDEDARTVRQHRVLAHPQRVSAAAMGNAQLLPDGHVFVGWGTGNRITEFDADGHIVFDATLPQPTYRAYRIA